MGLFNRKTDEQIIAEGRALYIKGDLSGASLKLGKIARKGHPEACFLIAKKIWKKHLNGAKKLLNKERVWHKVPCQRCMKKA